MSELSNKEIILLNQLSTNSQLTSQRELAKQSGISIGLLNQVLRKLIHEGYVRASALNKKKIRYLLTPKGCSQILRRSYEKALRTIHQYQELEYKMDQLVKELVTEGYHTIYFSGHSELSQLLQNTIRQHPCETLQVVDELTEEHTLVLNMSDRPFHQHPRVINIMERLQSMGGNS